MIRRLRPAYSSAELRKVYPHQYDHTQWTDHVQRVQHTVSFITEHWAPADVNVVADLSCGDGAIAAALDARVRHLGDLVDGAHCEYVGPIEHTVALIPPVDLFILSETLEHVDDPLALLKSIRACARTIFISTPLGEVDDGNPEHYWGWDADGVVSLLAQAAWTPFAFDLFTPEVEDVYYVFQMWGAR